MYKEEVNLSRSADIDFFYTLIEKSDQDGLR